MPTIAPQTQTFIIETHDWTGQPTASYRLERHYRDGRLVSETLRDDDDRAVPAPQARELIAGLDAKTAPLAQRAERIIRNLEGMRRRRGQLTGRNANSTDQTWTMRLREASQALEALEAADARYDLVDRLSRRLTALERHNASLSA